ncbi:hypothetical protein [Bartonella raoultii]|uniref:hypothetical protein n=1 Tax=Bartonella raoultii TaxID=1457020 RepID=UPI001ABA7292|nr:hypothetical protein [Bartonella raoultii]
MSDKQPLHSFSEICKTKPVHYYTITEQEIKSLQHNNQVKEFFDISFGFLTGVMILICVWIMNDDGSFWKKISVCCIGFSLFIFVAYLDKMSSLDSKEIWENVKQVSEVICEKK